MATTFNGESLIVTLASGVTSVDILDVYKSWKQWVLAGGNLGYPPAFRSDGGNPLSSIINQGSYIFLNNTAGWRIKPPEENITIYLTGNLAVEDTTLPAFIPPTGTFTAAILGLQPVTQGVTPVMAEQLSIASFDEGVSVDIANGIAGTMYPAGTPGSPSNNLTDALTIAVERGLTHIYVNGAVTMPGTTFSSYHIEGRKAAFLTLSGIEHARITDCMVSGSVGRDCRLTDCAVGSLTATNGYIHLMHCGIAGPLYLSTCTAIVQECSSAVSGENDTIFDFTNTASGLEARSFTGAMKLRNKNGAQAVTIDMAGGQVTLDSTVSNGTILLRGTASSYDNSTGTALVKTHGLMNPINVTATTNKMIEGLRPHHRGYGNIWYFDPAHGNDANDGRTPATAFLTFTATHAAVTDFGHDIILIVPKGDGLTISNQPMVITKNYLFIRGMGFNAHIHPTSTTPGGNLIEISGKGVELSGMHIEGIELLSTPNVNGIVVTGTSVLIEDLTVEECTGHGIVMTTESGHEDRAHISRCHIRANTKSGLQYNQGNHLEVTDSDFEDNGEHGVDLTGAGATEDVLFHHTNFLRNTGYGLKINNASVVGTTVDADCFSAFNGSGTHLDNGTDSVFQKVISNAGTAAAVWDKLISEHTVSGSFGEFIQKKILTIAKFIGLK